LYPAAARTAFDGIALAEPEIIVTPAVLGPHVGAAGYLYSGSAVVIVAIVIASALKMANTLQKFVILRAGKLRGVKGPSLFLIIPVIDHIVAVIDERMVRVR
jgi:regulator of protease activity HflC (stomatin/prohibitin superfamily)